MNAVASPVSVSILDREYQIACPPEERPGLIAAAAFLDGKMREVRNAARILREAVLAKRSGQFVEPGEALREPRQK